MYFIRKKKIDEFSKNYLHKTAVKCETRPCIHIIYIYIYTIHTTLSTFIRLVYVIICDYNRMCC